MNETCPHCATPLQQLGRNEDRGDQKIWIGENLYRCPECREPHNRFMLLGGVMMSAAVEGWLSMTSPEVAPSSPLRPSPEEITV